ncbi:hypothetical protein D3C87_899320 [compost metagenome]
MAFDSENPAPQPWNGLSKAINSGGRLSEDNPEIVAIFQQLKNLREADRSLRSLRRTMTLDNMPVLEPVVEEEIEEVEATVAPEAPRNDLEKLLESFVELKQEKSTLEARFAQMMDAVGQLQETVSKQAEEIDRLRKS